MTAQRNQNAQSPGNFGELIEPTTLRMTRLLPGPIELVWAYLTDSEKRGQWFCSGEMELREGGTFHMHFQHSELSHEKEYPEKYKSMEHGHQSTATITKCEPPNVLAFLWKESDESSEVIFELTPDGDNVRLVLTHKRLVSREDRIGTAGGWHAHLDILEDLLHGREPRGFWTNHGRLEQEYERRLGGK